MNRESQIIKYIHHIGLRLRLGYLDFIFLIILYKLILYYKK